MPNDSYTRHAGTEDHTMAPELMARGFLPIVDVAAADIYSLGITGIELLTGRRGVSNIKNAAAPRRLIDLLTKMTLSDASQRPTAHEVILQLTDIFNNDSLEQPLPKVSQGNDGLLAGLLIGGALLGGIGIVAALAQDNKARNVKLKL